MAFAAAGEGDELVDGSEVDGILATDRGRGGRKARRRKGRKGRRKEKRRQSAKGRSYRRKEGWKRTEEEVRASQRRPLTNVWTQ